MEEAAGTDLLVLRPVARAGLAPGSPARDSSAMTAVVVVGMVAVLLLMALGLRRAWSGAERRSRVSAGGSGSGLRSRPAHHAGYLAGGGAVAGGSFDGGGFDGGGGFGGGGCDGGGGGGF